MQILAANFVLFGATLISSRHKGTMTRKTK
jgi:hypothetical protein